MIDCNITANFLKELKRMCDTEKCKTCLFVYDGNLAMHVPRRELVYGGNCGKCEELVIGCPLKVQEIVQKWSDEHPQKTRQEAFLEKFPNALIRGTGAPLCCAKRIGIAPNKDCREKSCAVCWNEPYEE